MATLSSIASVLASHGLYRGVCGLGDPATAEAALASVEVTGADCDSRVAAPGHLFICKGAAFDPRYLLDAIDSGCVAWLADEARAAQVEPVLAERGLRVPGLVVADERRAMAYASAEAWGHPDRDLLVLGITGTKGKTTTAHYLRAILERAGLAVAFMGTHEFFDGIVAEEPANTTPEAPDLWRHLANARAAAMDACVMEVSSQGLKYDRTLGLRFDVGCFLNIGHDHISAVEHPTAEDYLASKLRLFAQSDRVVVNLETDKLDQVLATLEGRVPVTVGLADHPEADFVASSVEVGPDHVAFAMEGPDGIVPVRLAMGGAVNAENALCAMAMAWCAGVDPTVSAEALATCTVPGRMELFASRDGRLAVLVDYAHNDDSYRRFFEGVERSWPEAIVASVFGVSGGKALNRYEELPRIASEHSDLVVLTSDDPGTEDPAELVDRIAENVEPGPAVVREPDRERAVECAFEWALERYREGATVVLALLGKGRENTIYQAGRHIPIENDAAHAERLMEEAGLLGPTA